MILVFIDTQDQGRGINERRSRTEYAFPLSSDSADIEGPSTGIVVDARVRLTGQISKEKDRGRIQICRRVARYSAAEIGKVQAEGRCL
jgi:hypothetical protein